MIYLLKPYYRNFGKRITKAPKIYFLDCALVCYLTGIRSKEHLLQGPMSGALFENFVIQETIKSLLHHGGSLRVYYLRTHQQMEVDLLLEGPDMKVYPIEIKLSKTPRISMASNLQRFRKFLPQLDIQEGRIVSLSPASRPLTRDVVIQELDDYLHWLRTL